VGQLRAFKDSLCAPRLQERLSPVTTEDDEVKVARLLVTMQSPGPETTIDWLLLFGQ
jgi:hypothetical protein